MPNFNYENPVNINGTMMQSPRDQLFARVLDTLAYEGYQNLTLAGICGRVADSGEFEAFRTKDQLCEAALMDAVERIRLTYDSVTEDARAYLASAHYTPDESWKQLERLLYRHIYLCFHPKNRSYVLTALQECQMPQHFQRILPDALYQHFGTVLSRLILAVSEVKNAQIAAMTACSICGSINIFVQQPEYCRNVFVGATREKPNYAVIEDFLNNYFLRAVAANTAVNKPF